MDPERRVSDRVVIGLIAVALVLGIGLYNAFDWGSGEAAATKPAVVESTTSTAPATAPAGDRPVDGNGGSAFGASGGGLFGSGSQALADSVEAGASSDAGTVDLPDTPAPPDVPNPTCPTSVANDAYEQVVDPVSAAAGKPLPRDNVRLLAEIAAGCSNETAATPVIGLALDLSRLVPETGLAPVDLSAVPSVEAPTLPAGVIDALGPLADPIREGCATVGLLGVLVAVVPGAADVPIYGRSPRRGPSGVRLAAPTGLRLRTYAAPSRGPSGDPACSLD